MSDRRVHATGTYIEVVRYDRAGKWYIEDRHRGGRERVSLALAVQIARSLRKAGGKVHLGLPGGGAFDRLVNR